MTTLADRKSELDALLRNTDDTSKVTGVTAAFDHEPANYAGLPPVFTTCVVGGMTPESWLFVVRLYISMSADAAQAQRDLGTLMPAVDRAIGADSHFGPSEWESDVNREIGCVVATNTLQVGREDYF